tara:strand:- start:171 stop:419 length:249 start_codon:yes stop_codon:yes gene_type:complete
MINLLYFSWVREQLGESRETVDTKAKTVRDLVTELRSRNNRYENVFSDLSGLCVAVDQNLVDFDTSLEGACEVAFFPPMTGG